MRVVSKNTNERKTRARRGISDRRVNCPSSIHPEGSIDVFERWARALFLQRRHLLLQSEAFDHEVGPAPTHRPQRTGAERDDENEYTEHGG